MNRIPHPSPVIPHRPLIAGLRPALCALLALCALRPAPGLATDPTMSSLADVPTPVGTEAIAILKSGSWYKWQVSNMKSYFNDTLNFIPAGTTINSGTWHAALIGSAYGGTGLNTSTSTGFPYVSSGTWSVSNTLSTTYPFTAPHLIGNSTAPTKAAGVCAGTTPTITLDGGASDMSGLLTVTTGTSPQAASGILVTLTFASAYGTAPHVVLTPASQSAAQLSTGSTGQWPYVTTTTTTLVISKGGSTALAASTAYAWYYTVMQ